MPPLRQAVRELLANDVTLAAILTGGVRDAETLPQDGGGAGSAPRQTGGVRVAPYAVIRWRSRNRMDTGVNDFVAGRGTLEIYNHQDVGYDIIELAMQREIVLLNNKYLTATDRQMVHVLWVQNSEEVPTKASGIAPVRFVRFEVIDV